MGKFVDEYNYLRSQIEKSVKSNLELFDNQTAVFEGECYDNVPYKIYAPLSNMGLNNPIVKVSLIDNGNGVIMIGFQNGSSVNSEFISTSDLANLADYLDGYVKYNFENKGDNQ